MRSDMCSDSTANAPRIAVLASHPIQHFCPQYSSWAESDEWQLKVFFASAAGAQPYEDESFGGSICWDNLKFDFPHKFLNEGEVRPIGWQLDAPDIVERLEAYNPDVLLIYGYAQKYQLRGLNWGAQRDVLVLMFSDSEHRHARPLHRKLLKKLVLPHFVYNRCDGFLTVGDANERYHASFGAAYDQMIRSPYPIDRDFYSDSYENKTQLGNDLRKEYGIPEGAFVVGTVGKLIPRKRQEDIIAALENIELRDRTIAACIVGSGPDREMLRERARSLSNHQVIFPGFVPPSELPRYYAAMDVYIHPASKEAHSVAISEAIYMGCPIVLSDRCGSYGPGDDVRLGLNGLVYSCGSVEALAERLRRLVSSDALRNGFSNASHSIAVERQHRAHGSGLRQALIHFGII